MVDRQKELYHQQLAQAQAAQAAWLRGNGYSQHSGFPSGGSHGNTPVNPYENLMLQNIMGASNLLGNAANKDRAGFPSPFSFPGQFAQFGYQRPMAAHSANMKGASSSNPLAAHMISNPYQYPANYYGMNPNYLHAGESGGSGASAAGSSSAVAAMNNYMNRSAAASSPAPSSDRFRQQFEANSVERDSSRRGRGAQASNASARSSSLNGGSGMTAEANAAFNLQQLQAAYNQAAALNSNAGHGSSSSTDSPAASNKSKSSSYPNYFPGAAQSSTHSGQGFGSGNTSGTDINDHIAKEVMKTFGDSLTPQLLRQMQLSSMQHEAAAAAANPSHKATPDLSKDSRKAGAYPSVGSAPSAASMQAAAAAAAANSNQSRYSNQYRQQQDMKASYTSQQQQQQQQHQQQQQAMRASAMVSAAAAAAARGHSGSNSTPADPSANINSLMMEYLGGAAASSYSSPSPANKNNNQRPGVGSNSSSLQDYSNPLPQQYGNPREMVDNYFKSHANMGQSTPSNAPSMESVQQRQQQQQSSAQQREPAPQNLMADSQRLSAQTGTKHNQTIGNNGYQHHQNLLQQQHNMNQQQVEQHKQSQHKMLSPPDGGHTQQSQPSPMHSFQQSLSPANLHTSPGQTQSPSQPSPAAHVSPMGPSPSHPGPSPSHPGPSPSHPGPSPSHPGPSPSHPGPSPSHPGPSPSLPGPSPSHTGPSPSHTGPSPSHPFPSPSHPGPSPSHPVPSPSYTGPSPAYTGPSPSHPGPSPSQLSPSPTNMGLSPSPAHPGPSPNAGPSPSYTGPSPSHPGPSPSYTGPSSSYGGPSPSHQGPSPNSHVSPSMSGENITSPSGGQNPYSPNNIDPKMSPYSQAASPYSQNTNKMSPYSQPSPRMSPYSQQSPRMSPYSGMSPYSQHSPQMPSYSQPSPQMLPSYSQTSPKVNSYSSVSPVYHGNHLGAPQTSPSYHPRPPSPMNSLPNMETNVTEISSKSSLDLRSSPEPPLNKPIINEISLSKKCSNDSPRLDTPPGLALPPQHIEEEKVEKAVVEEKKNIQDSEKPTEPEILEIKNSDPKVANGREVDTTTNPISNAVATAIPEPTTTTTITSKPTNTISTTTTKQTNATTTVSTATTTTSSTTSSSSGLSNISSMTNKIKLLESKMHSAKNKINQERSTVEDNSLKKWWKPQQLVKETFKPSPAVQPSNSQQKCLLSPSLPECFIQQDPSSQKLSGDNQKENFSALVNTDNDNANDELNMFSNTISEKSLVKEKLSSKSERKHHKKSYQKESKRSRESSEPRDSFVDDSRELSRQRNKSKELSPPPVPEIDSFYSPVKKKSSVSSPVTKKDLTPSKKDSSVSPGSKKGSKESPVAEKKSPSSPVPSKASLRSPVSKKSSTNSTRKGLSYSPAVGKSPSPSKSAVKLTFANKSSSSLPVVKRSSSSKPVASKASLKEDLYSSKSKKMADQGKHSSSEKVKERRSSSRYDFDANTEEITAKEIKHGKFKSKALTSSNTSRSSSINSSAVSCQGRADSPGPNLNMMEIRNSGIPGPGAVTWKRKSVDDSPCGGSGATSAQMHKNKRRKVERAQQQQQPHKPQQKEESFRPDLFGEDDDIYQFDEKDPRLSPKKDPKNRSSKYTVYKYKRDLINRDADAHTPPPAATSSPTKPAHSSPPPPNHKVQSKPSQQKPPATVQQATDRETNEDKLRQSLIDAKLDLHGADKYIKKKTKRPRQEQWSLQHDDNSDTVKPVKTAEPKEEEVEDMDVDDREVVVKSEKDVVKPVAGKIKKSASDDLSSEDQHVLDEDIKKEAKVSANKWYQAFGTSTANTTKNSSIVTNSTPSTSVSLPVSNKPAAKKEIPKIEKPVNEDDSITDDIDLDDIKPDTSFLEIPPEVRRKTRPNFGGSNHFHNDWNRQVRRHHERCRLPKQLDSSVKLHPASIDGQATPRRSYEDYARKDMVSPPHLQTLERERLEAKAYTSVSLTTSTSDSDMEAKGELPSIVETILMNRKKLRQSFKMGRMYQIPFMKEKKKTRMRMRQAASQASAEDSNMGLLLTPGLPLLTDDTKEVLLGERIQTSSATSFGNFRPYTLNKYLEYGTEAEKPKLYMYGEPELFDSKTRSKANEKVFGPSAAEIFGREFSDKKSSKKDAKKPKKAKEPEPVPLTVQDNDVKPILSTVPNKASIDILEKLKEKSVAPAEPIREDDLFAFSQEVGEATEEENNLQSELGGLALDLLDNNPSWQHQVTIQNLVVWEPVEPLPASVKKKKPRKKRSRRSGMDFTPASRRKLAHSKAGPGGSCDASRASSPLGDEEEDEVHDITYTLDQVVQESMRWVVDKRAGETILQRAAKMGYPDVIAHALSMQGLSVKEKDFAGFVPLDKAALKGNHEAVRTLLRFGSDPSSGIKGTKAIHDAVESGSLETLYLLLCYGADPLHHNYSGSMPIDLANITGDKGMQHYLTNLLADLHGKPPPPARGAFAALAVPQAVTRWNVTNHTEFHQPEKDPKYLSLCPTLQDDVDGPTSLVDQDEEEGSPGELGDMMFEVSLHPLPTEFQFQDREGDFVMYRELKEFAKKFGHHKSDIREKCYIIEIKKSDFLRTARCKSIDRKINLEVKFHEREGEDSIILVRVDKFVRKIYNSESISIPR